MVSTPFRSPGGHSEYGATPPPPGSRPFPFPELFPSPSSSNQAVGCQTPPGAVPVNSSGFRELHPIEFVSPPAALSIGSWFAVTRGREVGIFNQWDVAANVPDAPAENVEHCLSWDSAFRHYTKAYYDGRVAITQDEPAFAPSLPVQTLAPAPLIIVQRTQPAPADPLAVQPPSLQPFAAQPASAQPLSVQPAVAQPLLDVPGTAPRVFVVNSTDPSPVHPPAVNTYQGIRGLMARMEPLSPSPCTAPFAARTALGQSVSSASPLGSPFHEPGMAGQAIPQPIFEDKGKGKQREVASASDTNPRKNKATAPPSEVIEISDDEPDAAAADNTPRDPPPPPNKKPKTSTKPSRKGPRTDTHVCDSSDSECADCPPMIPYRKVRRDCTCRCHMLARFFQAAATAANERANGASAVTDADGASAATAPASPADVDPSASAITDSATNAAAPSLNAVAGTPSNALAGPSSGAIPGPSSNVTFRQPRFQRMVYTDLSDPSPAATRVVRHLPRPPSPTGSEYFAGQPDFSTPEASRELDIVMANPSVLRYPKSLGDGKA